MSIDNGEIDRFQKILAGQEQHGEELWKTNFTEYNGIPIRVSEDFKNIYNHKNTKNQFVGLSCMLFSCIDQAKPILNIFPCLQIVLENKTCEYEVNGMHGALMPAFLYETGSHTLFMTSKGIPYEGIFTHELGHHIHGFFTRENHLKFLEDQEWKIEEGSRQRDATPEDIRKLMNDDVIQEGGKITAWTLRSIEGKSGTRYRHSSPCEMIAETVADNQKELYALIDREKLLDAKGQRAVIDFILSHLRNF